MKISIITDEISADPETAIELGVEWGVRDFEIRGYGTDRVPLFSDYQKTRLKELMDEYGIRIVAISPGLFKIPAPSKTRLRFPLQSFDVHLYQNWKSAQDLVKFHSQELLLRSFEFAEDFGVKKVIIFSFQKADISANDAPDDVLEILESASNSAGLRDLQLAIEVEDGYWADTGEHTGKMLEKINQPALGVNWDPSNALVAGDNPFPDGYEQIKQYVKHVHFKDVILHPTSGPKYVIEGQIDWAGQIRALNKDEYQGHISVETHMKNKVSSAKAMTARLQALLAELDS